MVSASAPRYAGRCRLRWAARQDGSKNRGRCYICDCRKGHDMVPYQMGRSGQPEGRYRSEIKAQALI